MKKIHQSMGIKQLLLILAVVIMTGCSVSSNYYVLSMPQQPSATYTDMTKSIGVKKVVVPKYLFKRELAVAKSHSEVRFLSGAVWAEDIDEGLTNRVIGFLQKKFNQPKVYPYPWGVSDHPDLVLRVQVSRFVAYGNKVYLDANWEIEDMRSHTKMARLFSTSLETKSDTASIVDTMDKTFEVFLESLAKEIHLRY
jgi:cholesterol transport system auxiliary component